MLAASDDEVKERCIEVYREEKKNAKRCIYQSRKKDMNGNMKLFSKEVSNAKGGELQQNKGLK